MLLLTSSGELRRVAARQHLQPTEHVDVDGSPLLELKSHHPMLDLRNATGSQCIAVFRHQSANEGLQNVMNVLGQEDRPVAMLPGAKEISILRAPA